MESLNQRGRLLRDGMADLKTITALELAEVIREHQDMLKGRGGIRRANLSFHDLENHNQAM